MTGRDAVDISVLKYFKWGSDITDEVLETLFNAILEFYELHGFNEGSKERANTIFYGITESLVYEEYKNRADEDLRKYKEALKGKLNNPQRRGNSTVALEEYVRQIDAKQWSAFKRVGSKDESIMDRIEFLTSICSNGYNIARQIWTIDWATRSDLDSKEHRMFAGLRKGNKLQDVYNGCYCKDWQFVVKTNENVFQSNFKLSPSEAEKKTAQEWLEFLKQNFSELDSLQLDYPKEQFVPYESEEQFTLFTLTKDSNYTDYDHITAEQRKHGLHDSDTFRNIADLALYLGVTTDEIRDCVKTVKDNPKDMNKWKQIVVKENNGSEYHYWVK